MIGEINKITWSNLQNIKFVKHIILSRLYINICLHLPRVMVSYGVPLGKLFRPVELLGETTKPQKHEASSQKDLRELASLFCVFASCCHY